MLYWMIWVPAVLLIKSTQLGSILTSCGCCEVITAVIDSCCQSSRTGVIITKFISPVLSNSVRECQSKQSQDFLQWLISVIAPTGRGRRRDMPRCGLLTGPMWGGISAGQADWGPCSCDPGRRLTRAGMWAWRGGRLTVVIVARELDTHMRTHTHTHTHTL